MYQRIHRYDDIDLRTLVWLGRETEALNHARFRSTAQKKFISLFILYKLLVHRGQPNPSLLRELQETAHSIEEGKWRVSSLGMAACTFAEAGLKTEAEVLFAEAKQIALEIENESQQAWVLKELVIPFAHASNLAEAEEIARRIKDSKGQIWSLATVGSSLTQAGQ